MLQPFGLDQLPDVLLRETGDVEEFRGHDAHVPVDAPGDPEDLVVGFFREGAPEVVGGDQPLPGDEVVEKPEETGEQGPAQGEGNPLETGKQHIGKTL